MRWLFIQVTNLILLVLILIGIPAITSLRFGALRLSSDPQLQMLTLGGLGVAAMGNLLAALFATKQRRAKRVCWSWALFFAIILAAEYGYFRGYLSFAWLKSALLWVRQKA